MAALARSAPRLRALCAALALAALAPILLRGLAWPGAATPVAPSAGGGR